MIAFRRFILSSVLMGLTSCSTEKLEHITTPKGVEYVDAGKMLVDGLAACGFCHGAKPTPESPLSGGQTYNDIYGETTVPNITPAKDALGKWNTDDLLNYFRRGLNQEGDELSQVPHRGMEWMSDDDLFAIIAYLRTLPPVKGETSSSQALTFMDRNTSGFFQGRREVNGFVPSIPKKSLISYGGYLVENVARCGRCHNSPDSLLESGDPLSGGQEITNQHGTRVAPDITSTDKKGFGAWSEEQIVDYLQSGRRPHKEPADSRFCPIKFYRNAPVQDLRSIARYLKSVEIE